MGFKPCDKLHLRSPQTMVKEVLDHSRISIVLTITFVCMQLGGYAQYNPSHYTSSASPLNQFNDGYQNINPYVNGAGNKLWFTKMGHPSNHGDPSDQDVWMSEWKNEEWTQANNMLTGLNSEINDLIIGQSNGEMIYVMQYKNGVSDQLRTIKAFAENNGSYSLDHTIRIPDLKFQSEFFGFFVAADESFILLSMKGPYSFGKEDLYALERDGDGWSEPIHLGARINTVGFEMSPYMHPNNKYLFFASEGHHSYGSADIFVAVRMGEGWQSWSKPINLGPNINTESFEAYFSLNLPKSEAYFVSNSTGVSGSLFTIPFKAPAQDEAFTAHPSASGFIRLEKLPAMNVKLNLLDENDRIIQSITTNDQGYFNLQSFLPDRDYKIAIDDSIRQGLSKADIFLTNDLGEKMVFMNERELGMFGFKVLSGQKMEEVQKLEEQASKGKIVDKPTTISGKVATFGTLNDRVSLSVVDENNRIIDKIETDENGYFSFSTNSSERSYFLSVDQDLSGLVDVYEIFLTNDNPNEDIIVTKTDKHLFEFRSLKDGSNEGLQRLVEYDNGIPKAILSKYARVNADNDGPLSGYLKLGKLPMIDTEIKLLDENDRVIERVVTDEAGRFVFNDKFREGNYKLMLEEPQQSVLDQSEIYLARNPQDVLFYLNDNRSGVFAFKKLAQPDPRTLYSLRVDTEDGKIVQQNETSLKGKFAYAKLPKSGVKLKLLDENENIIQVTEVKDNGEFEFENYTVNKNYFIAVEGTEGLADIYEIYISGQQKNVLVNNANKFVFSFKILPSQDILLTQSFVKDTEMSISSTSSESTNQPPYSHAQKQAYHEFDINVLRSSKFVSLKRIMSDYRAGYNIALRLFKEEHQGGEVGFETITESDLVDVLKALRELGVSPEHVTTRIMNSDQIYLFINH